MVGLAGLAPSTYTGSGSCSQPTSSVGRNPMRAWNWGSSPMLAGVLNGAMGVLISLLKSSHSSQVLVAKMALSSRCSSVLPRAWSA